MKVTDGYWWWRPNPQSKWKIVHVTDSGTRIRRIGYTSPSPITGEFRGPVAPPS